MGASSRDDLRRDVGQLLWIGFAGPSFDDELRRWVTAGDCGAVIAFKRNLAMQAARSACGPTLEVCDVNLLDALFTEIHAAAPADDPVWIAIDQEGGRVQRLRAPATHWPPMLSLDALAEPDGGVGLAEEVGLAIGRELAAVGVDVDFAPVLDVHSNESNPIIGDRAFGREPGAAARRALAFARGLDRAGLVACGKHFPGHGDTTTDSHLELPRIDHPRARLDAVELAPFRAAAAAGLPTLMTAHVVFSAIDPTVPATLSRRVITQLLREELGYRGLVLSDDLDMKAIADHFGIGDAAVRAIDAGCDVLLLCREPAHMHQAREALLRAGEASTELRARIGAAAARVRAAKRDRAARAPARPGREVLGAWEHRKLADRLAGRA